MLEPETIKAYCKANPNDATCPKSMASYTPSFAPTDPNGVYTRPPMPSDSILSSATGTSTNNILIIIVVVIFGGVVAFMTLHKDASEKPTSQQAYKPAYQQAQQYQQQPYYQPMQRA